MNLRDELRPMLTDNEMEHLKTSFDIVGDIAIIEIDDELVNKEKVIANTLLESHKNINVVCKKSGIHSGTFRTQDLVVISGENRKETISKENGVQIKLDAEKIYFSPRLSTERKRISEMLKKKEKILAMFSGSGPYPVVMLKKEPTVDITSIEINPVGVEYQIQNLDLNKSIARKVVPKYKSSNKEYLRHAMRRKINVIEGDVRAVVDKMTHAKIGLKCALIRKQIDFVIKQNPEFIELHLHDGDMEEKEEFLFEILKELESEFTDVVIHLPENKYQDNLLDLYSDDVDVLKTSFRLLSKCNDLLFKFNNVVGFVVHPCNYITKERNTDVTIFKKNILKIKTMFPDLFGLLYFENLILDFYKTDDINEIANIANICFDINHFYCVFPDTEKMAKFLDKLVATTKVYFHIADSNGHAFNEPHSLEVGKGEVDFSLIEKYIDIGTIEVVSKDYSNPVEMINSYNKIKKIFSKPKFNRILMPLPKSAEEFLPSALKVVKKGTIVHFYDFLHVDDFDLAKEKIKTACNDAGLKYQILDLVKCGQHAPRVFRICVDFKIL